MMNYVAILCLAVAVSGSEWASNTIVHSGWAPHGGVHKYGPAPLAHDGQVIDTPEISHAKAAHFAAHAKANAAVAHSSHSWAPAPAHSWAPAPAHSWAPAPAHSWAPAPAAHSWAPAPAHDAWAPKWHGPQAHIELTHDGKYVKDTPEVAHARAAHLAAHSAALHSAHSADHYGYEPSYAHGHW